MLKSGIFKGDFLAYCGNAQNSVYKYDIRDVLGTF